VIKLRISDCGLQIELKNPKSTIRNPQSNVTISEIIATAAARLAAHKIENSRLDAEVLLGHVLNRDRAWLIAHYPDQISDSEMQYYEHLVERRAVREPLQYITAKQEFWGLDFLVTPDVLIPRPETELVVENARSLLRDALRPVVIDLCTGSGCIAICLARELTTARIFATDRSAEALTVARTNANHHGVEQRIRFIEGDLFGPLNVADMDGSVSVITANPPYVPIGDMAGLQPEVRDFEPELALLAGPEGTEVAGRIISEAPRYLRSGGSLVMEFGMGQAGVLRGMADRTGAYSTIDVLKDLAGIDRVLVAAKKQNFDTDAR